MVKIYIIHPNEAMPSIFFLEGKRYYKYVLDGNILNKVKELYTVKFIIFNKVKELYTVKFIIFNKVKELYTVKFIIFNLNHNESKGRNVSHMLLLVA